MPCRTDHMEPDMPCSDGGCHERLERERTTKELELLRSLLCSTCRTLEANDFDFDTNPRLSEWWARHKAEDEQRQLQEAKRKQEFLQAERLFSTVLLSDMTDEQRQLLKRHKFI